MLEEYSVRSSDATIDIVYSDFSGSDIRDSDLISITNEIHNNDSSNNTELGSVVSILTTEIYKKIFIICSIILFILVSILLYFYFI